MLIYHGSSVIVEHPQYQYGKKTNDYGQGFYCTENIELAREWACPGVANGFCNQYSLNLDELCVIHLNGKDFNILNWLALLLDHRRVSLRTPVEQAAAQYILKNYRIDFSAADILIGYRADDRYFTFVRDFLSNQITLRQLSLAMHLGKLGEQVFLQSEKAFRQIRFLNAEPVSGNIYFMKRKQRADQAAADYNKILAQDGLDGIFIADILRGTVSKKDLNEELRYDRIP